MPTDSYTFRPCYAYAISVSLLLCCTYNSFATNLRAIPPSDSAIVTSSADTTTQQLMVLFKPDLRLDMVNYAKRFLGARYRPAGRDAGGFDCSGFTHSIARNFDIKLSTCSSAQGGEGVKVLLKDTKPGDLVLFHRTKRSGISHVAMVISNDERGIFIIHSTSSRGVMVDNLLESKYWRPKIYMTRDVVTPFEEKYTQERAALLTYQYAQLKRLDIDVHQFAKAFRI